MDNKSNPDLLLLIGLAAVIFLLAAGGLMLLQDPEAPLPWEAAVSPTATPSPVLSPTPTELPTETPVYITSYTPFVTRVITGTGTVVPTPTGSLTATLPTSTSSTPASSTTPTPTNGPGTPSLTPPGSSLTPTISPTLEPGEFGLTGRVVQDGTPASGILVTFSDDQPERSSVTDANGYYWFVTLAIGASFTVSYDLADNPQLAPSTQVAETVWLEGFLPSGSQVITLPDLEINVLLDGQTFEPTNPADRAAFDTDNITPANPIQFSWTTYNLADYYYMDLRGEDKEESLWLSPKVTTTNVMFDGELDDGSHIGPEIYNWYAVASLPTGAYRLTIVAQPRTLIITP